MHLDATQPLPFRLPTHADVLLSYNPVGMVIADKTVGGGDKFLGLSNLQIVLGRGRAAYQDCLDAAKSYADMTGCAVGVVRRDDARYAVSVLALTDSPDGRDKYGKPLSELVWTPQSFDFARDAGLRIVNPVTGLRAVVTPNATVVFSKYGNDTVHRRTPVTPPKGS